MLMKSSYGASSLFFSVSSSHQICSTKQLYGWGVFWKAVMGASLTYIMGSSARQSGGLPGNHFPVSDQIRRLIKYAGLLLFSHSISVVSDSIVIPWTVAHQAPLSIGFPRQEHWSELPFPSPGDLPDPGIEPRSPALASGCFTIEPVLDHTNNIPNWARFLASGCVTGEFGLCAWVKILQLIHPGFCRVRRWFFPPP